MEAELERVSGGVEQFPRADAQVYYILIRWAERHTVTPVVLFRAADAELPAPSLSLSPSLFPLPPLLIPTHIKTFQTQFKGLFTRLRFFSVSLSVTLVRFCSLGVGKGGGDGGGGVIVPYQRDLAGVRVISN